MKLGAPEPIAALNRIRIVETGEPLVDIREFCPDVDISEHVCPYLRRAAAERLNRAQSTLPPGYKLRVGTALRTLHMQKGGWDRFFEKMKEEHPSWPLSALRRATNKYFAPYDQPAPPGHCTGGAVDVGLLSPEGEPLDLIAPTKGWEAAYTWSDKISPEAKSNRMMMVDAMLGAGFSNCRDEYWHYSYGDSAWAVRVGEKTCPYGFVEPPIAVEAGFKHGAAEEIRQIEADTWECRPRTPFKLHVGIFWAHGKRLTLRIAPAQPAPLYLRNVSDEEWQPVEAVRVHDALLLQHTPAADRVYITSEIPPKEPDEQAKEKAEETNEEAAGEAAE